MVGTWRSRSIRKNIVLFVALFSIIVVGSGCDQRPAKEQADTTERKPCPGDPCFNPALAMQTVSGMNGARFGYTRSKGKKKHDGVDLLMQPGSNLYAMRDGFVYDVGVMGGYGNYIVYLCSMNGMQVYVMYAHIRSATVKPGTLIKMGDVIAISGQSGNLEDAIYAGGVSAHMHLEVRKVDPLLSFSESKKKVMDPEAFLDTQLDYSGRPERGRDCHHKYDR